MTITGQESTEDLKLQFARRIFTAVVLNSSILKVKDVLKIPDLEKIVTLLKKRSQWNGVRAFLQSHPCFFLVTEESGTAVIKPIVTIEFCRDFDGKRGCSRTFCAKLHVCRHFVKGKCTFGPRCKKPHHFQTNSTREVLKKHFLDELNDEQAREFLCRNVQHLLDPEAVSGELPKSLEICKYYNVATGCTREICPYIHVCRFYAEEGNCKFGSQCIRKHDINNVHSRILLHRYHMEHLNDPQVIAYLKIKGESGREQQQQQQQQQQPNLKSDKPLIQVTTSPNLLPSFSLPNGMLGNLHNAIANDINRKLSQPNSSMGLPIVDANGINTRKLSLPTPPISQSMLYRPPVTAVGPNAIQENIKRMNSFNATIEERFNNRNDFDNSQFSTTDSLNKNSPKNSHQLSRTHIMNTHNDSIITNSLQKLNLSNESNNYSNEGKVFQMDGLGLSNLSPPSTTSTEHFTSNHNTSTSSQSLNSIAQNINHTINTNNMFLKSRSFENFSVHDNDMKTRNGMSKSYQSNYLPYTNSFKDQPQSFFTSLIPFVRATSNDIISPTGSTSSVNGTLSTTSNLTNGTYNSTSNSESNLKSTNKLITDSFNSKSNLNCNGNNYFHSSSNLNDSSSPTFENFGCGHNENGQNGTLKDQLCTCQKNQICIYNLKGGCRYPSCKKVHTDETFQWQVSSVPLTENYKCYKNENFDTKKEQRWLNVEKNENLKLESAFCATDIDEQEIDFYGDSIIINFNEMIGLARSDINLANQITSQRSCDLSAWLLQSNDDAPHRRNSQDGVIYSIRRLSTRSSVVEEFDLSYATLWLWYWQDSFGIWRSYPSNKSEVIEANNVCYSDELENRFLEGYDQYMFEDAKILVNFKAAIQINCLSGKQKKVRRRPKFLCKEQRENFGSYNDILLLNDVRRPWYWNQDPSNKNHSYELVDVDLNTDTFSTVRNHFTQSLNEGAYKIVSMKSVQNLQLWKKFISLRTQFDKSSIKYADKFVFKSVVSKDLSGICQQGFQLCTCEQKNGLSDQINEFASDACTALGDASMDGVNGDEYQYMFCVRMSLPLQDIKTDINKTNGHVRDGDKLSGSPCQDSSVPCRHSHQIFLKIGDETRHALKVSMIEEKRNK